MTESFTSRVYQLASKIPKGKVSTYAQLATLAGNPKAARAVGTAMKHNPDMLRIPCHRVVGSNGAMRGYAGAGGVEMKKKMLMKEGIEMVNERVIVHKFLWQPDLL